jgi:hypothetical protein
MPQGVASYAKLSESKAGKSLKCEGHGQHHALSLNHCVSGTCLRIVNPSLCCYYDCGQQPAAALRAVAAAAAVGTMI